MHNWRIFPIHVRAVLGVGDNTTGFDVKYLQRFHVNGRGRTWEDLLICLIGAKYCYVTPYGGRCTDRRRDVGAGVLIGDRIWVQTY